MLVMMVEIPATTTKPVPSTKPARVALLNAKNHAENTAVASDRNVPVVNTDEAFIFLSFSLVAYRLANATDILVSLGLVQP
jgi:hypothetical protein